MDSFNGTTAAPGKWDVFGFTTTPQERMGPPPPYATPALQANLFFRVFLGIVSLFVTWVPARLLWRNGEFAGTVLCVMLMIVNFTTVINSLIWRDDNVKDWWVGYGWCDFQAYTYFAFNTAFNISMFEVMRGLASKVSLHTADKPSRREVRRQRLISALIIFTLPAIQVVLTYFASVSRYNIATLVGCTAVYYPNWMYLIFFLLPTPIFAILAAYCAGLVFYRYRNIDRTTREVLPTTNSATAARQHRVRVKLYFMTLVVIIIVLPLIMIMLFVHIIEGAPWDRPYDFDASHYGPDPYNIYFISFTTSDKLTFAQLNIVYVASIGSIAIFIPFGTTPEAINMYRTALLFLGLGFCFPRLREEYVPNTERESRLTWPSIFKPKRSPDESYLGTTSSTSTSTRKDSLLIPIAAHISPSSTSQTHRPPSTSSQTPLSGDGGTNQTIPTVAEHNNPWPDLSADEIDAATASIERAAQSPLARNPLYSTILPSTSARLPTKLPSLGGILPHFHRHKDHHQSHDDEEAQPGSSERDITAPSSSSSSSSSSPPPPTQPTSAEPTDRQRSWWSPFSPSSSTANTKKLGVATRVWAERTASSAPQGSENGGKKHKKGTTTTTTTTGSSRSLSSSNPSSSKQQAVELRTIPESSSSPATLGSSSQSPSAATATAAAGLGAGAGVGVVIVQTQIARHWSENPAAAAAAMQRIQRKKLPRQDGVVGVGGGEARVIGDEGDDDIVGENKDEDEEEEERARRDLLRASTAAS